jgi:hypothetical protein
MDKEDYSWLWSALYVILVIAFFVWVFLDPPSYDDWWNVDEGLLPSFP